MSVTNGRKVFRIEPKGTMLVQFGDAPVIEVDAVGAWSQWSQIDDTFRDEKGILHADRIVDSNRAAHGFVRDLILASASAENLPALTLVADSLSVANALEFIARVSEEVMRLQDFFVVRSPEKPSSQGSTELRFST